MVDANSTRKRLDLTAVDLKNLQSREREYEVMDPANPGFGVRVLPSGKLRFMYRYRDRAGKLRRITFKSRVNGKELTLAAAREEYRRQRGVRLDAIEGGDPLTLRRKAEAEEKARLEAERQERGREEYTVSKLVSDYIEWAEKNKKSWKQDKRTLEKVVLPVWGGRPAHTISRKDVIAVLDKFEKAGKLPKKGKGDKKAKPDRYRAGKAMLPGEAEEARKNMPRTAAGKTKCHWFTTFAGCRLGDKCPHSHDQIITKVIIGPDQPVQQTVRKAHNVARGVVGPRPDQLRQLTGHHVDLVQTVTCTDQAAI